MTHVNNLMSVSIGAIPIIKLLARSPWNGLIIIVFTDLSNDVG